MIIGISGKKQSGKDTVGKIIQYLISYTNIVTSQHSGNMSFQFFNSIYKDLKQDWEIKKFADKIKDIVCLLINCTREQLEDEEFKNTELGKEWWKLICTDGGGVYGNYLDNININLTNLRIEKTTPRKFLQLIGTECGRNIIHPNTWINILMKEYNYKTASGGFIDFSNEGKFKEVYREKESNWIITDLRFPNELKAIKDKDSITIRINRPCEECGVLEGHKMYVHKNPPSTHPSETALDTGEFDYTISNDGTIKELIEQVKQILIKEHIL